MTGTPVRWPGCHGARLVGDTSLEIGVCSGDPLVDVRITLAKVDELQGDSSQLWCLDALVQTRTGPAMARQRLMRSADGRLVLSTNRGAALEIDLGSVALTVQGPDDGTMAQLVASYGIPLVLAEREALFLHGSACTRGTHALVVIGPSGSGKSSLLVRLVDSGWGAVTEDVCALDLRGEVPTAWPGPPWVRRLRDEPGPTGSTPRFETEDKIVWDTAPWQASTPTPLGVIVVLEGGSDRRLEPETVSRGEALSSLAAHSVWLGAPDERSRALFERVARVSAAVKVVRLSLPRSSSWLDDVPGFFEDLLS